MCYSNRSAKERATHHPWSPCGAGGGNWSAINIAAMVFGFILFWPIGLFLVFWIACGRTVMELPGLARQLWQRMGGKSLGDLGGHSESDNIVFNEYQKTQYDRIREIKEEINERSRRFQEFRQDAKRRADEEEFNKFMASSPLRGE